MPNFVYVHIDNISNAVLTQEISAADFHNGIIHQPRNLLLLDPTNDMGEFEAHTAMKIIRGSEAVEKYFQSAERKNIRSNKWIDFTDTLMLKELSAIEISELLYFGHMKTHLHSPFFYKLQNNFAYFNLQDGLTRTYYRYLDEFYHVLSQKITHIVLEKLNSKRSFFQKPKSIKAVPADIIKKLSDMMKEGLVFSFDQTEFKNKKYEIPLYLVEDTRIRKGHIVLQDDALIGDLIYYSNKNTWELKVNLDELELWSLPNSSL